MRDRERHREIELEGRHDIQHKPQIKHDTQHNDIEHNDTQHNDTQHNDTQHNGIVLFKCGRH
jgi:hypothetical protein